MSKSHIGLLPTWADTYGYSLLEFMAAGCPVISTNVRALTEINSSDRGYIINLPLNNIKEVFIKNEEDKESIR
ncbi:glycosyltransferase, partial [Rosenbergiella epipactidis]|uniref:glycosyltransferase n=1 Tax=Rosenbergiella epipactidis TaxID=1544694 RepID=UPI001F4F496D